jgi:phage tail tape-measure protein
MRREVHVFAVTALGILAACGTQPKERTTGGAAAGAATGAGVGALAGPPGMAVGALIGGGAGAATGAATSPKDINLGKPPWTNSDTRVPTPNGPVGPGKSARAGASQDTSADSLNAQSLSSGASSFR